MMAISGWNLRMFAAASLAASLHFLATVSIGGYPARLAVADLFLPVGLATLLLSGGRWRYLLSSSAWASKWYLPLIAACTAWLFVSIMVGRFHTGRWIPWALVQKGIGWLVLMGYMLVGAALATANRDLRPLFCRWFIVTAWLVAFAGVLIYQAWMVDPEFSVFGRFAGRVEGFFDNPNAYGIAMVAVAGLQMVLMKRGVVTPNAASRWGLALLFAVIVLSRSRSAWIAVLPMLIPVLWLKLAEWRTLFDGLLRTAVLLSAMYGVAAATVWLGQGNFADTVSISIQTLGAPVVDSGVNHRLRIIESAIGLWREAPIMGIGLGSFYVHELASGNAATIHTSALWLLAETGLIGLTLYSALFVVCIGALWRAARGGDAWAGAGLGVVLALAVSSVGTEILYQRYLWMLVGMTLVVPAQERGGAG